MKKPLLRAILLIVNFAAQAQVAVTTAPADAALQPSPDAERARITTERARLESAFTAKNAICYQKFLVNDCLDAVKVTRRERLADLRRQEVSLDAQDRRARGAEQIRKTEDKASPEMQQREADRRADALKDFDARIEREKQKNAVRADAKANEKSSAEASVNRIRSSQDKTAIRATKQSTAAEEARKFTDRQDKAKERQARQERDQLNKTKPAAKPLPLPD